MKRLLGWFLTVLVVGACRDPSAPTAVLLGVIAYPDSVTMVVGDTMTVSGDVYFYGYGEADITYDHISTHPEVASVKRLGLITALIPGTTLDIVQADEFADTTIVVVVLRAQNGAISEVTISPDSLTLLVGQSAQLGEVVRDGNGVLIPTATVQWGVADQHIASVSATGLLTGKKKGTTWVGASAGGRVTRAKVVVVDDLTLEVQPATDAIDVFQVDTFTVVARDGQGNVVPAPPVVWSSSDAGVAPISEKGIATGLSAGFTNIVATAGLIHSEPAVLQVNGAAAACFGIGSAAAFQVNVAWGFKAVDQPADGGFLISADDGGNVHALIPQQLNTPFEVAWYAEVAASSSASVTQSEADGTSIATYTSTGGAILPLPAPAGLPKITLIVDMQHCTYRLYTGASVATLLTDHLGNQTASVDIVATVQFAGAVPPDWRTGFSHPNGVLGGHSTAWGGLHLDQDALMPLGFAAELFTASDTPAGEASGGFQAAYTP